MSNIKQKSNSPKPKGNPPAPGGLKMKKYLLKTEPLIDKDKVTQVYRWRLNFKDDSSIVRYIGVAIELDRDERKDMDVEFKLIELPGMIEKELLDMIPPGCTLSDLEACVMKSASIK